MDRRKRGKTKTHEGDKIKVKGEQRTKMKLERRGMRKRIQGRCR